jgi:hypothetical protein
MNRKNVEERPRSLICGTIVEELNKTTQNHNKNNGRAGRYVNVGTLRRNQKCREDLVIAEEA